MGLRRESTCLVEDPHFELPITGSDPIRWERIIPHLDLGANTKRTPAWDICGKGLLQGIEFVQDVKTRKSFPAEVGIGVRIGRRALANGLLCRFEPNWLAFGTLLAHAHQVGLDPLVTRAAAWQRTVLQGFCLLWE